MQYNTSLSSSPSTAGKLCPQPQGLSWKVRVRVGEGPGGAQLSVGTAGCTQPPKTETQQRKLWEQNHRWVSLWEMWTHLPPLLRLGENFSEKANLPLVPAQLPSFWVLTPGPAQADHGGSKHSPAPWGLSLPGAALGTPVRLGPQRVPHRGRTAMPTPVTCL